MGVIMATNMVNSNWVPQPENMTPAIMMQDGCLIVNTPNQSKCFATPKAKNVMHGYPMEAAHDPNMTGDY